MNTATLPSTPAVESVTTSLDTLQRIIAVHRAGCDPDRSTAVLSGINVFYTVDGKLTIAATDGKLLVEETFDLSANSHAFNIILPPDAIKAISGWIKSAPKLTGHRKVQGHAVSISVEGRIVTITGWGSSMTCKTLEGTYPAYQNAFTFKESAPGEVPRQCESYALNLAFMARLAACWDDCTIKVQHGRGLFISPLNPGNAQRRALIMTISLP